MDVFLTVHEAEVKCKLRDEDCVICLPYGEKVPVDRIDRGLGGNAFNNVVGLSRMGFKTSFFTIHGDDEIGELIEAELTKENIDQSLAISHEKTQSRYSTIINFKGERTILEFHSNYVYRLPHDFPKTKWIYLSSVGRKYEEFFAAISALVKEHNILLAFTPNNNQLNSDLESYLPLIEQCQVIFMNLTEAAKMLRKLTDDGLQYSANIRNMLSEIYELGPKTVVITNGKKGSFAYDGSRYYQAGIMSFPMVSATGAGDAFASGFMAAIMNSRTVVEAIKWGTANAGSVVSMIGAQKGLLNREKMEEFLAENSDFQVDVI